MEILQHIWGSTPEGEGIILYTMRNSRGSEVQLCNIGASIVSVKFADRNGNIEDVALGAGRRYVRWRLPAPDRAAH